MPRPGSRSPELALPVVSLAAMRTALAADVGSDAAARALRGAGHAAGDALAPLLLGEDGSLNARGQASFFRRLAELFATRGWGHLAHQPLHEGIGALDAADWVEANPDAHAARPSCFFTTGMLANLLGRAAGSEIAVLEAECRSRGDARCRFLFGAPDTLHEVYERLRAGDDVDALVAALD